MRALYAPQAPGFWHRNGCTKCDPQLKPSPDVHPVALFAGSVSGLRTLRGPAAAVDFPEQPDTNPGAEDNGCAAITGHPGVVTSVANEADQATAIPTQLFVDACLGGP